MFYLIDYFIEYFCYHFGVSGLKKVNTLTSIYTHQKVFSMMLFYHISLQHAVDHEDS